MALRQGWPLLARNKILTVSEIWNEHLLKRTSANQQMGLMSRMCYSCVGCDSVCVLTVQSARRKLHVVPSFIRSMLHSVARIVKVAQCVAVRNCPNAPFSLCKESQCL